jgi:hypothetical protein
MVIDCGERWTDGTAAGASLLSFLGKEGIANLESIVVSHFDDDHWRGLVELAVHLPVASALPKSLNLFYPTLPRAVAALSAAHSALISTAGGQPVNVLELEEAWNRTGRYRVQRRRLSQGDIFSSAGERWLVHWPPRELESEHLVAASHAIDQVWEIARELRDKGDSNLLENLRRAYEADGHEIPDTVRAASDSRTLGWELNDHSDPWTDWIEGSTVESEEDGLDNLQLKLSSRVELEPALKAKFTETARRIGRANNSLSLVIEALGRGFVGFGDLEGPALKKLCQSDRLANDYHFMLAPHHGTHQRWNQLLPTAKLCVSQNGAGHQRVNHRHKDVHVDSCCVSTFERGFIAVDL